MAIQHAWWTATHPGDTIARLPGLRIRAASLQQFEDRMEEALSQLETKFSGWITNHSANLTTRSNRKSPQVGAH